MATYIQIGSTVTVGVGGAATIAFTSIPATYTDLKILISARNTGSSSDQIWITLNSSTTGFSNKLLYGSGTAALSGSVARYISNLSMNNYTVNTFGSTEAYFSNYSGSDYKSVSSDIVNENNASLSYAVLSALLWSNTAAITSITLTPEIGTFAQHSTATLYGIKKT
jgi:hypothetical protein